MLLNKKSGFTLIELMVVIVIIGVLASLAIPRFTEASYKAKVAEAPRVLASYSSAQLAAVAEGGAPVGLNDLIFERPTDSKWFSYSGALTIGTNVTSHSLTAVGLAGLGRDGSGQTMTTTVDNSAVVTNSAGIFAKVVPNFK